MASQLLLLLLVVAVFLFAAAGGAEQKMINQCSSTSTNGNVVVNFTVTNTMDEEKTLGWFVTFEETDGAFSPASERLAPGESLDKRIRIAWSELGPETVTPHLNIEDMNGNILASTECGQVVM